MDKYCDEIIQMEGFGEKSYQKLITSIEQARKVTLPKLIFSLGIANIGLANAKVICRYFKNDIDAMRHADVEELSQIDGIGEVIARAFVDYFAKEENSIRFDHLLTEVEIEQEVIDEAGQTLEGKVFVVTGSLEHFSSRNELKDIIEKKGGKVTGSVTSKTDCLINNDSASNSSKNKKAKELQIPIVTEEEFMKLYLKMEI